MPYRSSGERRNKTQLGVGWSLGGLPPTPIPEQVLDGLPGFAAWLALLFCIASAVAFPQVLLTITALVGLYSSVRFLIAGLANLRGLRLIRQWEQVDWRARYEQERHAHSLPWEAVAHIVIIPNYKEPMSVLRRTLDSLAAQYEASKRLIVVLAMEAAEANCAEKAEMLVREYAERFRLLDYTVHPRGLPGEMQCKSANEAWAARWVRRVLVEEMGYDPDHLCVTTMDADTRWHPNYFAALTCLFANDPKRALRFWQAPIRYHGNIWDINPLLRIVNAYSTALELAYLAAPWWKALPMSSYSLSLRLLESSGYWDVDVIADEWHMFIKAYFAKGGEVTLEPIMLPFMADATVGENVIEELRERYRQTLRHAWGSKEVGYTVAKIIDHPEVNFWRSFRLLVRIAHDILLAGAGWIILTLGSQLPLVLHPSLGPINLGLILSNPQAGLADAAANLGANPVWIIIGLSGALVVVLGFSYWLLDVNVRPPRTHPLTLREALWTLASFPLLPLLSLIVLAIPTLQAQTRLLLGIPLQFRVSRKV